MRHGLKMICLIGLVVCLGVSIMAQTEETGGVSAREKLSQAFDNAAKKDYCMEGKIIQDIEAEEGRGLHMDITLKYINKAPDISHLIIETMGQKMEAYRKGDIAVVYNPMLDDWLKLPEEQAKHAGRMPFEQFKEYIKEAKVVGEEKVNEKDCEIIEASVSIEGLQEMTEQQMISMAQMFKVSLEKAQVKAWCGKEDSFFYKFSALIEGVLETEGGSLMPVEEEEDTEPAEPVVQKMALKVTMEGTFSDYDSVELEEIPTEVRKLLEGEDETEKIEEESEEEDESEDK